MLRIKLIKINLHSDILGGIITDRSLIYYYYAVTIDVEFILLL